jgi:hypothetical protein
VGTGVLDTDRPRGQAFRAYLLKGGFAVFEDFDGRAQWSNFETQMKRVLPEGQLVKLDNAHRIYDSFFAIKDIEAIVHPMSHIRPNDYGVFEDNDPAKRLMVVANFDNDVPEYCEWSGQGLFPFDASNEAYKLGVNYIIYGLTHCRSNRLTRRSRAWGRPFPRRASGTMAASARSTSACSRSTETTSSGSVPRRADRACVGS